MPSADVVVLKVNDRRPVIAKCSACQQVWTQPSTDPTSQSLSAWAGSHICQPVLFPPGTFFEVA